MSLVLILLPWGIHIISSLTVCSYWAKHKANAPVQPFSSEARTEPAHAVFLTVLWYHNDKYCDSTHRRQKTFNHPSCRSPKWKKNLLDLLLSSIRKGKWSNSGTALTQRGQYPLYQGGWNTLYTTNSWQDFTLLWVFISFYIRPLRVWKW